MSEAPNWDSLSDAPPAPEGTSEAPNWNELQTPEERFGGIGNTLMATEEGLERGLTLGASDIIAKKFRNKLEGRTDEEVEANQEAHPIASTVGEVAGTGALLHVTGGLGLGASPGAGFLARTASNAGQGAIIGATHALTHDLAYGDPNLLASKLLAHVGTSALWGAGVGGAGSVLLDGTTGSLKALSKATKFAAPDLSVDPESLGAVDKIRMGLFSAAKNPAVKQEIANSTSSALNSLNELTSAENLALTADAGDKDIVDSFLNDKKVFLKEFGDPKTGKIDPEEVISFITNPASKNSSQQTIAFNHLLKSIDNLSGVTLKDADLNSALKEATNNLQNWQDALADAHFTTPHADIEYGAPGETKPYSTKFDLEPGKEIAPNYSEGVTIGKGDLAGRVSEFGSERVSPFQPVKGFSTARINSMMEGYQKEIGKILEKQSSEIPLKASEVEESLSGGKAAANTLQNLALSEKALQHTPPSLGAGAGIAASHIPGGPQALALYSAIRNFSGDGGLYRLGAKLATPVKILEGIGNAAQKVDQRMADKARLIFTASSSQARKLGKQK